MFYFQFFHAIYLDHILSFPLIPPRFFPLPDPLNFLFFLSQKKIQNKNKEINTNPKQNQNVHRKHGDTSVFASFSWESGMSQTVVNKSAVILLEKTDFLSSSIYQLVIVFCCCCLTTVIYSLFPFSLLGLFSRLKQCRFYIGCQNVCEFICVLILFFLDDYVSLESSTSGSYNPSASSAWILHS